jgi:membrane protease YdiL (CAAX protease family)
MIKKIYSKFCDNKLGWVVLVSLFAAAFFVALSVSAGIVTAPFFIFSGDESLYSVVISIFAPILMLGLTLLLAKLLIKRPLRKVLKLKKPNKKVWWMVPATVGGYIVLLIFFFAILYLINPQILEQEQDVATALQKIAGLKLMLMAFGVTLLTPIAEELFFRGLLLSLYAKKVKFLVGVFVGAVLFGLAHLQLNVSVDTFLFGIALGLLTWQTESIYPAIALHILKNGLALTAILK